MKTAYGVPVPRGVYKTWEASSMTLDSGGAMLRGRGVPAGWDDPLKCVAWFDTFGRCRACVGYYANGRAVLLRSDMNGKWSLKIGHVPRDRDGARSAETACLARVPLGTAKPGPTGIAQIPPSFQRTTP